MFVKTSHLEIFKSNQFGLNSNAHTLIRNLQQIFEGVTKVAYTPDSLTFHVSAKDFFFFMYFLKASTLTAADQLVEISCVDNLTKNQRFELNYHLLSLSFSTRYMVTINIDELESVPSISKIYFNAAWMEREVWDLFGIHFLQHTDLRRILTDYGFKGHPLRKDFPLTGYLEMYYDDSVKSLVYSPVSLAQEYRDFKFTNPWSKAGL